MNRRINKNKRKLEKEILCKSLKEELNEIDFLDIFEFHFSSFNGKQTYERINGYRKLLENVKNIYSDLEDFYKNLICDDSYGVLYLHIDYLTPEFYLYEHQYQKISKYLNYIKLNQKLKTKNDIKEKKVKI